MEKRFRALSLYEITLLITGVIMTLFYIVTLVLYPLSPDIFRTVHMLMISIMVFLSFPLMKKSNIKKFGFNNVVFIVLSAATFIYAIFQVENVLDRGGIYTTNYDLILGTIAIIVVLEATRRTVGPALPIIALIFLLYAKFGQFIPGTLGHTGYSYKRIITSVYTYDGIFGMATAVMATFVAMFIIFAEFLDLTGVGSVFLELSKGIAGKMRGGPAKIATLASAFFGSISGSAVANVAATGSFTIPLMKKIGYKPYFAAAVESAASTGGQFMPPIMAAGAFLMTEIVGVPYLAVIKAALIPALLYYTIVWVTIDFRSAKRGLKGLSKDQIPDTKKILKKNWATLLPLVVLIFTLVILRYSPIKSAFYSLVLSLVVAFFYKDRRPGVLEIATTMSKAARAISTIAAACACAGIVIGLIGLTGLGLKIATLIINLSGGKLLFALFLSMLTAILFGMGLPTTVSYLLCVAVLSPVLIRLGIDSLAANLFIFYFAALSGITPPVALAAYTGAGIAGSKPMETAFQAVRMAAIAFFLPYMFVYNNALMMEGSIFEIAKAIIFALFACFALSGLFEGWLYGEISRVRRVFLLIAAGCLIYPHLLYNLVGSVLFVVVLGVQVIKDKQSKEIEVKINDV